MKFLPILKENFLEKNLVLCAETASVPCISADQTSAASQKEAEIPVLQKLVGKSEVNDWCSTLASACVLNNE